ncbi:uncharacterized protein YecT (DUF1311 family) [Xanthomonas arboricola]|nr:lysozyme inhibitor LprI family protein [Xanthomonas cannabis]NIK02269.1 uncharacterized protein YecT (DUF1311 family) [Xanthomonas cannabis]NIK65314.1 uncharacterized protein YecT (DUF1311 family) [Xanthomonas cannabis]
MIIDQARNQVHMTMRPGWICLALLFSASSLAKERCHDLETTTDSNKCWSAEVDRSQQRLAEYLAAARTRAIATLGVSGEAFDNAQAAWTSYKTLHCSNIRQRWTGATVGTPRRPAAPSTSTTSAHMICGRAISPTKIAPRHCCPNRSDHRTRDARRPTICPAPALACHAIDAGQSVQLSEQGRQLVVAADLEPQPHVRPAGIARCRC